MKLRNRYNILLGLLLLGLSAKAQSAYQPLSDNQTVQRSILRQMHQRFQKDLSSLQGAYKEKLEKEYTRRYEDLSTKMTEGHFLTDEVLHKYFGSILQQIISVNPCLQDRDIRLLVSRYNWPNASCRGEGTLVLNLGLISRLENESQIAFVICHELAHDYMNHVNTAIHSYVDKLYGKETQKELKKIAKSEYNTYDRASELLQSLTFNMRRHGRLHEEEADSLALEFMRPSVYDTREAIKCLNILNTVDQPKRPELVDLRKHFDSELFQLKERWLRIEEEESIITHFEETTAAVRDSLKTHPDCEKRIEAIQSFEHREASSSDSKFEQYIRLADYEIIEAEYQFGQFGKALFHSFQLLEEQPTDAYLHSMVLNCLYELHQYQKGHELGKVLSLPNESYPENYNQFLHFIHNLRLRDLAKLGYYYGQKNFKAFTANEEFRVAYLYCASLVEPLADWQKSKRQYYEDFPNSLYRKEIRKLSEQLKSE
ncbi:MAG: M48 family metalloprotease [Bacteroidota bacterium]